MSYSYYQNAGPAWGTNQYQFANPPAPSYQPQPSWGGIDYYRAHAPSPDNSLWDYAWSRVKNFVGAGGVGKDEAKYWHQRAYGGLADIRTMLPLELGAAAAYEAYRTWKYNSSLYEPLSGDRDRQREALVGLAIGEAARIWQSTGRMDGYGRKETSEHAAATASRIWNYMIANQREAYDASPRRRPRSVSPFRPESSYGDNYVGSYQEVPQITRHNSMSRLRPAPTIIQAPALSSYGSSSYLGTQPISYASPAQAASYAYGQPSSPYGSFQGPGSYTNPQGVYFPQQSPAATYVQPGSTYSVAGQPVAPGSTIIIEKPRSSRSRRHSHSHHKHSHSHSHSGVQYVSSAGYGY